MTKSIFSNLKGIIQVETIVKSTFTKKYIGSAQIKENSLNSKSKIRDLFRRAVLDTIFQHFRERGLTSNNFLNYDIIRNDYEVVILDYKMKYLGENKLINIKRERWKNKKYYSVVRDKKTNKILTYKKWSYERNLETYTKNL